MRGCRPLPVSLFLASSLTVLFSAGPVAARTKQICLSNQLSAAGSVCRGVARCYRIAMKRGIAVAPNCIPDRQTKLTNQFASTESASDCLLEPGAATVWTQIEPVIADIAADLGLGNGKCAAKKIHAIAHECKQLFRCYTNAVYASDPGVDPACIASAQAKEQKVFDRADLRYMCATSGDAVPLSNAVSLMVDDVYTYLRDTGTTTTSTTTSTSMNTTTTTVAGAGTCPEDGSWSACLAYANNTDGCMDCVDATIGDDAGIATLHCSNAGPACSTFETNALCGFAINHNTDCAALCCP